VDGEADFEVGVGFQYFAQVISPIGMHLDEDEIIPLALPNTAPGMHYWFNVTLNRSMPLRANYSKMADNEFGLRFNITINEIDQRTRPEMDARGFDSWFWKGYQNRSIMRVFILDNENLSLYASGREFFPIAVMNATPGTINSVIVPDDREWHIVVPGKANPLTRSFVNFTIEASRSKVTPEAIIRSPDPGNYYLGESIHFSGELDPYPPYLGEVQYRWFKNDTSEPISEEEEFDWAPDVGLYQVTFSVWDGKDMIGSDNVIFEVVRPNRAPISAISSPDEGSIFIAGTEITFGSEGTWDPDDDPLYYLWSIPLTGTDLSIHPSFSRKFIIGDHTVKLNVTDPEGLWSTSTISFTVIQANSPPSPFISLPENYARYYEDETVVLSAYSSYDIDGDEISFNWESNRSGHLSDKMEDEVQLAVGEHLITLTVSDGNASASTNVTINIDTRPIPEDLPPVAVISKPFDGQNFFVRDLIEFSSLGSLDPEGHPITYLWKIDGNNVSTSAEFSMYLRDGVHTISLTVSDLNRSVRESIMVIITNRAPIMNLMMNSSSIPEDEILTVIENDTLIFDASGSLDPDGGSIMYTWTLDGEIIGSDSQVIIKLERGYHELRLTIIDEDGRSATWIRGFNCLKKPENVNNTDDTEDGGKKRAPLILYIIPSILIILFLLIAIVFFLLSRDKKDEYFEE
jgi:hypothetical protein